MATVDELAGVFRLPVASSSPLCIRRNTDPSYENMEDIIIFGYDEQGIVDNPNPIPRGINTNALTKHTSSFGLSGAGKTTGNFNLLYQLFEKRVPFMVVETAKKEYRALKKARKHKNKCFRELAEILEVYTLGAEEYSPLRFNPLEIPKGIGKYEHIDNLMGCFLAAMPSFPALPGILSEALEEVYDSHSDPDRPPIIADLYAACLKVLSEKSYCEEVSSNIRAALEVRLGSLTRGTAGTIFNCRHSVPNILHLMSLYSILEIDRLSDDHKCLIPLFIMTAIRENLKCLPPADGLRFVMLFEESHNIFGPSGEAKPSEETPDPKAFVAKFITRMLAELRSLGVGIFLCDQHPTSLDPSAVKSTSTKIAFRQTYGKDREELGLSMLLSEMEVEDIARLGPGEAFFYKEGYYRPIRIRTRNLHKELDLKEPTDEQLLENIRNDKWFQDMASMRVNTELDQLKEHMDEFENKRIAIMKNTVKLEECYKYILDESNNPKSKKRLLLVMGKAGKLKKQLLSLYKMFRRGPYKRYSPALNCLNVEDANVKAYANDLSNRFESVVKKGVDSVYSKIEQLIKNCKTLIRKGGVS
ncbi:ATP-binding protein [Planctomycetota bacterium]